jgi:hypothetical protein
MTWDLKDALSVKRISGLRNSNVIAVILYYASIPKPMGVDGIELL